MLRRWFGFRLSRVAVTCAAAAVMIAALMPLMRTSPARSVDVDLEAWRGEVGAEAPAGRPLRLRVAGEGLPQQASFALEVVSESGGVTRRVEGVLDAATIHGELREGLAAGRYWVRVVDARGNQVLRESMLTVR